MYRRPLVLAIYEPRWFRKVLDILNKRRIPYTFYYEPETLPAYSILYTDYEYFTENIPQDKMITVFLDPGHDCRVLEEAILASKMKNTYHSVSIGIDPGPKPYIVVLGDGEIIDYKYIEKQEIIDYIVNVEKCYPTENLVVRVGGGFKGLEIAVDIRDNLPEIQVEIVDEEETTPKKREYLREVLPRYDELIKPYRNKDAYAALRIALRKGLEVI